MNSQSQDGFRQSKMEDGFYDSQSLLTVANTEPIHAFLCIAAEDPTLSPHLRRTAFELSSLPCLPYSPLRALWVASPHSARPPLLRLFSGCELIFKSPKPREKSEELKVRLRKLSELAERKAYHEIVKDITPKTHMSEPFSSYKDQMGFGLHVVLTMFTGYLVGYAVFRALFSHNAVLNVGGGLLGLVLGMLLETFLFMIKTSNYDGRKLPSPTSKLKKNQ